MNFIIDSHNRIVLGQFRSIPYLSKEIAYRTLETIKERKLYPNARKSSDGWISTIDDREGRIVFSLPGFATMEEATNVAENNLK